MIIWFVGFRRNKFPRTLSNDEVARSENLPTTYYTTSQTNTEGTLKICDYFFIKWIKKFVKSFVYENDKNIL